MKNKFFYSAVFVAIVISGLLFLPSCSTKISGPSPEPADSSKVMLAAYYPFDSNVHDESGNGLNGVATGLDPFPDRHGNIGGAYHFDGVHGFVEIPDNQALRLSGTDFTLNAWVLLNSYTAPTILTKRLMPGTNSGWQLSVTNSKAVTPGLLTYSPGEGGAIAIGKTALSLNIWHMVTCIYKVANNTVYIYVDGTLDNTVSGISPPSPSVTAKLYIGRDDPTNTSAADFFAGSMDDIRIYGRVISANEVKKLYQAAQ